MHHNEAAEAASEKRPVKAEAPSLSPLSTKPSLTSSMNRGIFGVFMLALLAVGMFVGGVARGQEYSAVEAGSVVGYEEGRRLAEHRVSTMTELTNRVIKGNNNTANGDTTTLSAGVYKCSDGTCPGDHDMLYTYNLYGTIQCLNDHASFCVLDGESIRRLMYVRGEVSDKLTIRAIRFYKGKGSIGGGGVNVDGAVVDITLCVFDSCETYSHDGGGGIYVSGGTLNIYGTTFKGNSAPNGYGDDIYRDRGTVTIHDTCPSPYTANTPTQGTYENSMHHTALM